MMQLLVDRVKGWLEATPCCLCPLLDRPAPGFTLKRSGRLRSSARDRFVEVELRQTLGVDERVDRGDPAAGDGEPHHGEQSPAWRHYGAGRAVDERGPDERVELRVGGRVRGHGVRASQ